MTSCPGFIWHVPVNPCYHTVLLFRAPYTSLPLMHTGLHPFLLYMCGPQKKPLKPFHLEWSIVCEGYWNRQAVLGRSSCHTPLTLTTDVLPGKTQMQQAWRCEHPTYLQCRPQFSLHMSQAGDTCLWGKPL